MLQADRRELIRRLSKWLETIHSASYFSRAVAESIGSVGVSHPSAIYLAGRAAPMGAVPASVVAATFYNFNPAHVRRFVPECWTAASPAEVTQARLAGVEAMLGGLFGAHGNGGHSAELPALARRLADSLRPVLAAQLPDGRPLFAAHQELLGAGVEVQDASLQPFMDIWVAGTLLREYRGDGHIGALLTHDLSGAEAVVLHCITGTSFRPGAARKSRGWSEEEWELTIAGLRDRGLALGAGENAHITEQGAALREEIERDTDASVEASWSPVQDEALVELAGSAKDFAKIVIEAEAFPAKVFAPGAGRTPRR
ncbi:hypothetical protein GCM10022261_23750 [Brevibacterium daeguense]|uniref:SalK n=1 Tax=Brevibacterium daeguense TaxID=909936 RepID=A0ABP8ELG6_9MICO|nr:hypothetical protein [Brevibacterium daeguense]